MQYANHRGGLPLVRRGPSPLYMVPRPGLSSANRLNYTNRNFVGNTHNDFDRDLPRIDIAPTAFPGNVRFSQLEGHRSCTAMVFFERHVLNGWHIHLGNESINTDRSLAVQLVSLEIGPVPNAFGELPHDGERVRLAKYPPL